MKITKKQRDYANLVIAKYTKNLITNSDLFDLYSELDELGISFMITGYLGTEPQAHTYELDGEMVENSMIIWGKYYPSDRSNRFELTCYLS